MTRTSSTKRPPRRGRKLSPVPSPQAPVNALDPEDSQCLQECVLEQIAQGAQLCQAVERQLGAHPAPELQTIIQLHRSLVLKLSVQAQSDPGLFNLVSTLMRPVIEWARLEEKRKDRELAEQKYRDQAAAQKAEQAKEQSGGGEALRPTTLEKIERELHLF